MTADGLNEGEDGGRLDGGGDEGRVVELSSTTSSFGFPFTSSIFVLISFSNPFGGLCDSFSLPELVPES